MRAKFINETVSDVLTPKSREEIKKLWPKKNRYSYEFYEKTQEELEELGVDINKLMDDGQWSVNGFQLYVNNWGAGRFLTREDAQKVADAYESVRYSPHERYNIEEERIYLSMQEARQYIIKKNPKFQFGKLKDEGESWRW